MGDNGQFRLHQLNRLRCKNVGRKHDEMPRFMVGLVCSTRRIRVGLAEGKKQRHLVSIPYGWYYSLPMSFSPLVIFKVSLHLHGLVLPCNFYPQC